MEKPKFLTVFAVFDDDTQKILHEYQNEIIKLGRPGTQTMDIPFHVTLGSFPTEMEQELIEKINVICEKLFQFELKLLYAFSPIASKSLMMGLKNSDNVITLQSSCGSIA